MTQRLGLTVLIVAMSAASCARDAAPPPFYRFVDHEHASSVQSLEIDGMLERVLDPSLAEHVFPLDHAARRGTLAFSIGVAPEAANARFLFAISLQTPGGHPTQLYKKAVTGTGWLADQVPLDVLESQSVNLVFQTSRLDGPSASRSGAVWGNPVLLMSATHPQPSVILISIDTLRADRLGIYGNTGAQTPAFDGLGRSGVLYEGALSPSGWTLPSHASLLYGAFPSAFPTGPPSKWRMPPTRRPLPEILHEGGYLTAAFTGGGFLATDFGFARGFDEYYEFIPLQRFLDQTGPDRTSGQCTPDRFDGVEVFKRAREWVQVHARTPFFLFVHTYEVHDTCPFQPHLMWSPDPGPAERQRQLKYYDGLIARTDGLLAGFLSALDALQLSDTTLVVLTSDHGEGFWEHGSRTHGRGKKLYGELTQVPLIVRWPARLAAGSRVPEPVSLVDVAPTILALLGLPPEASMQGPPLPGAGLRFLGRDWLDAAVFRGMQGGALPGLDLLGRMLLAPVFVQCDDLLAVRTARYKLVTAPKDTLPASEIYDMFTDSAERDNIVGRLPSPERELRAEAASYWRIAGAMPGPEGHPVQVNDQTRERLKALGYAE